MKTIGVRALRQNASQVLRRVAAGETVEVTDRGRPVARLVPIRPQSRLEQLIAEGSASPAEGDILDLEPVDLPAGTPSLSSIVEAMRNEERY